jgi:hypothetical protein
MPEPDLGKMSGAEYGIIGTMLMAVGAGIMKVIGMIADRIKSKDDRINEIDRERFRLVLDEWKADRTSAIEQQRQNAMATRELAVALSQLKDRENQQVEKLGQVIHDLRGILQLEVQKVEISKQLAARAADGKVNEAR